MAAGGVGEVREVDSFDLPEWLGTTPVTWSAASSIGEGHLVRGELTGHREDRSERVEGPLPCNLLAVDRAYPAPVLDEEWRRAAHQAWSHSQVALLEYDGALTLAVPGTGFTADLVLETLGRLAKALGVKPARIVAALRL